MSGFEVDVSLGQGLWWTRCNDCGLTWMEESEDDAVATGFAHRDEVHPEEEIEPEAVRVATSIVPWRYGTDVVHVCAVHGELARIPLQASDKARAAQRRKIDDHLDKEHPWQVRPGERRRP